MSDVKWIKITTTMFDDEKIQFIEAEPGSAEVIVIWMKLLCLAGKLNTNGVFKSDDIIYTPKRLALLFRKDEQTVKDALKVLEKYHLIDIINDVITIPNWAKHQSLDKLEKQKEYQRLYKREQRRKQRQMIDDTAEPEIEEETVTETTSEPKQHKTSIINNPQYLQIIDYLNEKCGTSYRTTTKKTQQLVQARWNDGYTVDDFCKVIDHKASEWKNDPKYSEYLRPETLFGSKFESYLEAANRKNTNTQPVVPSKYQ